MAQNGNHTITGPGRKPNPPASPIGTVFAILFFVFLFIVHSSDPTTPQSTPTPPTPPAAKTAVIAGLAMQIVLTGGSYEYEYVSLQDWQGGSIAVTPPVFIANLDTNETKGSLSSASTIIVYGKATLDVDAIGGSSTLDAEITSQGNNVHAYFRNTQFPRGPPSPSGDASAGGSNVRRAKIIFLAPLVAIGIGAATENSSQHISILDLDPSQDAYSNYLVELATYNSAFHSEPDINDHSSILDR